MNELVSATVLFFLLNGAEDLMRKDAEKTEVFNAFTLVFTGKTGTEQFQALKMIGDGERKT